MNRHQTTQIFRTVLNAPFSVFRPFNVCLWHAGRCGSTVLADLLGQDGRFSWGGEILERYSKEVEAGNRQSKAWNGTKRRIRAKQLAGGAKIFGFEIKVWHLRRMEIETSRMLDFLRKQGYEKHIILERKNFLRIFVSGVVGRATSKLHYKMGEKRVFKKIYIDPEEVRHTLPIFESYYQEIKTLLPKDSLIISYEDDILPDPIIAYKKIIQCLNLTPRNVAVKYKRTNPELLEKIITNIDEIHQDLSGTRYEWMLTGD